MLNIWDYIDTVDKLHACTIPHSPNVSSQLPMNFMLAKFPFHKNSTRNMGAYCAILIAISTPLPFILTSIQVILCTFCHNKHLTDVII